MNDVEMEGTRTQTLYLTSVVRLLRTLNTNQWRMASRAVQNWLITIIDPNILRSLRVHGSSTRYGDECWRAVNQIVNGHGLTESRRVWLRTFQMKRSEFGSLEHYINTLREHLIICERVEMTITRYQAALLLLDQTAEELPNWTTVSELELSRQTPAQYDRNLFFRLCGDAIGRSRKEPQFLTANSPPTITVSNPAGAITVEYQTRQFRAAAIVAVRTLRTHPSALPVPL